MATVNEQIQDATLTHQVQLQYYGNGVINRILKLLASADADIVAQLNAALERMPQSQFNIERLDALLGSVREVNANIYQQITAEVDSEMRGLVEYEAGYQQDMFKNVLPVQISFNRINVEQAYTAALSRPFQGRLLSEWMKSLETDQAIKIRDAVRMGYVENQTTDQIVRRIRGTRALNYRDGVLEISRNNARTVVRTAISHMSAFTRDKMYEDNDELVKSIGWHATLDGRTTETCIVRDRKQYTPVTHKPIGHNLSWLGGPGRAHFNCRSVGIPVLKSWRELGLNIDDAPETTRASMDGQVPAELSYAEWLKKRSAAFQDEVLGVTKGKLFREGMPVDRFVNNEGKTYTIAELRKRDAEYFERAGV
jgi:hypothetical protein